MLRYLTLVAVFSASLTGCSAGTYELFVDVRTDLAPGVEFTVAEAMLDGQPPVVIAAPTGTDFAGGVRLAEYSDLAEGVHTLDVALADTDGVHVLERRVVVTVVEDLAITVVLSRDCQNVICPMDEPDATTCLGGLCVEPACSEVDPSACPSSCASDAECMVTASCTAGRCLEGVCLSVPDDSMCPADYVCLPERGCLPDPTMSVDCSSCPNVPCTDGACDPIVTMDVYAHQCAVHASGRLSCWGENDYGETGVAGVGAVPTPMRVPGISNAVGVAVGANEDTIGPANYRGHTCVLHGDRTVSCWGHNGEGELGNGSTDDTTTPTAVPGLSDVVQLATRGNVVCALHEGGTVSCWGLNNSGQVGDGTLTSRTSPTAVVLEDGAPLTGAVEIGAGVFHVCARLSDGGVFCWGNNATSQLAAGSRSLRESNPVDTGITGAEGLAVGGGNNFVIQGDGNASAWGLNTFGSLGIGAGSGDFDTPMTVMSTSTFRRMSSSGSNTTCAIDDALMAHCWGRNLAGQVGDGTTANRDVPVPVVGVSEAYTVHPGFGRTFIITPEGSLLSLSEDPPVYVGF